MTGNRVALRVDHTWTGTVVSRQEGLTVDFDNGGKGRHLPADTLDEIEPEDREGKAEVPKQAKQWPPETETKEPARPE